MNKKRIYTETKKRTSPTNIEVLKEKARKKMNRKYNKILFLVLKIPKATNQNISSNHMQKWRIHTHKHSGN